jgi:glycosyltransferase involved in cell wall biosynthesis
VAEVAFAIPGDLASATGGYAYARRLLELLPGQGISVRHVTLPASFPDASDSDLAETDRLLRATPMDSVLLIDGLAYGAIPPTSIAGLDRKVVALVHHPLFLETGLSEARRAALLASEKAALAEADRVITSSGPMARLLMSDFNVPGRSLTVAEPGTERSPRARGTGAPVALLAVGTITPRKGYDVLVEALEHLDGFDWRLTIVGAMDRAPDALASLRAAIASSGLGTKIRLAGQVTDQELAELYDRADVLVSPSLLEGYGMALTEAMARGLPLVASRGGAAAETVPDGVGLKVPPGDVGALRDALGRMITDPALRRVFAEKSWIAGQALPRWHDTAARVAEALKAVAA